MGKAWSPRIMIIMVILRSSSILGSEGLQWPDKQSITIEGHLYLAGYFSAHSRDKDLVCGETHEDGLQQLESFIFTLKEINKDVSLLPNITLGTLTEDTCYSSSHTLSVFMDHLRKSMASDENFLKQMSCSRLYPWPYQRIVGVIGGKSSSVSMTLANLYRTYEIPQVSYEATAPPLSNKKKYKYFFRTVPSLDHEVRALIEIIKDFRWNYISLVYSDSVFGNAGFSSMQRFASEETICFATKQRIELDSYTDRDYDDVIEALLKKSANAVVLLGEGRMTKRILAAATRKEILRRFVWLGWESLCSRHSVVKDFQQVVEGSLCVDYAFKPPSKSFSDYITSLTPENYSDSNPWLYELWEKNNNCRLQKFPPTPYNEDYAECSSKTFKKDLFTKKLFYAELVRNAVYSIAHALNDMHQVKCGGEPGLCHSMNTALATNRSELLHYLYRVKFNESDGTLFHFDENGDALPRYRVSNFQRTGINEFAWIQVGTYTRDGEAPAHLNLNRSIIRFKRDKTDFLESVCSAECKPGQTKVPLDNKCCWVCRDCKDDEYINATNCTSCDKGFRPSKNKTACEEIPEVHFGYSNPAAIVCIAIAIFGILTTTAVTAVFWKYWNTPIVKASSRELSAVLLLGIYLSFCLTFVILARPTTIICGLVRFFMGFTYTVCYAAIVSKTRRIAYIFGLKGRLRNPKYTSPQSQVLIAAALVAIGVVINATSLLYNNPSTDHYIRSQEEKILICRSNESVRYLFRMLYPLLLMIVSTVFAFQTRKCPDGYNEARHICFANYTTCVIWLAFLITFIFSRENDVRTVTLCLLLSLSGMVQIACLFLPKVYIAIFRPQSNTKDVVMGYTGAKVSSTTSS